MKVEQVKTVCEKYNQLLVERGEKECYRNNENPGSLSHIRWMLLEIPKMLDDGKYEKAHRWLGFVQGTLWAKEISTVEELKDDNR
jgi:hypothetical protein